MPASTLAALYNVKARVNVIYMRPRICPVRSFIDSLSKVYKRHTVTEAIPEEENSTNGRAVLPHLYDDGYNGNAYQRFHNIYLLQGNYNRNVAGNRYFQKYRCHKKGDGHGTYHRKYSLWNGRGYTGLHCGNRCVEAMAGMLITSEDAAAGLQVLILLQHS